MKIYLLRHGIAEPQSEGNRFSDADRALTPQGITKLRQTGLGLKKLGVSLDLVASSPLVRARETAENVTEIVKCKEPIQLWDQLAPGGAIDNSCRGKLRLRTSGTDCGLNSFGRNS